MAMGNPKINTKRRTSPVHPSHSMGLRKLLAMMISFFAFQSPVNFEQIA
jgi:hypothetical protein